MIVTNYEALAAALASLHSLQRVAKRAEQQSQWRSQNWRRHRRRGWKQRRSSGLH